MGRKSLAEERKEEILNHYYEVVVEEGFEKASIAKIAAHMKTQPSLIMHYFKNKDNLVFELLQKHMSDYVRDMIEEYYLEEDLYKRLDMILDFTIIKDKFPEGISKLQYIVRYLALQNNDIREELKKSMHHYTLLLKKIFNELYLSGIIANPDAESLANFFTILISGFDEIQPLLFDQTDELYYNDFIREVFKDKLQIIY